MQILASALKPSAVDLYKGGLMTQLVAERSAPLYRSTKRESPRWVRGSSPGWGCRAGGVRVR
eukprot:1149247-Pelagomonas_calceolata.AAC.4